MSNKQNTPLFPNEQPREWKQNKPARNTPWQQQPEEEPTAEHFEQAFLSDLQQAWDNADNTVSADDLKAILKAKTK